jgi:hypothetical protein
MNYQSNQLNKSNNFNHQALTITFGECAENHKGMQMIGHIANNGFNLTDLNMAKQYFDSKGYQTELIDLKQKLLDSEQDIDPTEIESASVLIIHNGINAILSEFDSDTDMLYEELINLDYDTKAFMYGRVVNKSARYNLCFSDHNQEPAYEEKKGRIVSYDELDYLPIIRHTLSEIIGDGGYDLKAEANYYFDTRKTGIGFHGDSERKKVIALRLGKTIPLHYQWFYKSEPVGPRIILDNIGHGSMYIMSEKATGHDWKKKNIYTLRHAAGSAKYTTI